MPEPNRPPWQVAPELNALYGWQLLESGMGLSIHCDACGRITEWHHAFLKRRFKNLQRVRMPEIASRLRCSKCRSNWVKVFALRPG
jgi:hypothetical protein